MESGTAEGPAAPGRSGDGRTSSSTPNIPGEQVMGPHGRDASTTSLVAGRFDGSDWFLWKRKMETNLMIKKLYGLVSGSEVCPVATDVSKYEAWRYRDISAQGELLFCFTNPVLDIIKNCDSAKTIWDKLIETYEEVSLWQVLSLRAELYKKAAEGVDIKTTHTEIQPYSGPGLHGQCRWAAGKGASSIAASFSPCQLLCSYHISEQYSFKGSHSQGGG